jgi:hypothetical protein
MQAVALRLVDTPFLLDPSLDRLRQIVQALAFYEFANKERSLIASSPIVPTRRCTVWGLAAAA